MIRNVSLKVKLQNQAEFKKQKDPPVAITKSFKVRLVSLSLLASYELFSIVYVWSTVDPCGLYGQAIPQSCSAPQVSLFGTTVGAGMPTYSKTTIAQFLEHHPDY